MTYYFECVTSYNKESLRAFTRYHYRHVVPGLPILLLFLGAVFFLLGLFQEGGLTMMVAGAVLLTFGVNLLLGRFAAGVRTTASASLMTGWSTPGGRSRAFIPTTRCSAWGRAGSISSSMWLKTGPWW